MGNNYRAFEDKHGFLKFFISTDLEFEIVLKGLDSLKGSSKWGPQAKELEDQFIKALDGLISQKLPQRLNEGEEPPEPQNLFDEFYNPLMYDEDFYFTPCDILTFRRIHDKCIRLFKDVRDSFDLLIRDDRRDLLQR